MSSKRGSYLRDYSLNAGSWSTVLELRPNTITRSPDKVLVYSHGVQPIWKYKVPRIADLISSANSVVCLYTVLTLWAVLVPFGLYTCARLSSSLWDWTIRNQGDRNAVDINFLRRMRFVPVTSLAGRKPFCSLCIK